MEYERSVKRMIAAWDGRDFASIERDDITALMDEVEARRGREKPTLCCKYSPQWPTGTPHGHGIIAHHSSRVCGGASRPSATGF